ncbi:hypothetical protein AW736_23180 [Termitidicoccus mucosus]|uniref:Histidine kinase domain-containing protein n=2 Tax=Termitidicoccus mucosus TaxID=1184151 RepID=A0A178ICK7_9BACT|nr:hypothetical protein AW736_23180 [Opitutaceae bacterium TSB47]
MSALSVPATLRTFFAPPDRAKPALIQKQAKSMEANPLIGRLLNASLDCMLVLNAQRQIVFASENVAPLIPGGRLASAIGKRPGEALGCIRAIECEGGCGTAPACSQCGAVKAILEGLAGRSAAEECRMTRLNHGCREALDLRVKSTPFSHAGASYTLLAVSDISHEKRRLALEQVFLKKLAGLTRPIGQRARRIHENASEPYVREDAGALAAQVSDLQEALGIQRDLSAAERGELLPSFSALYARDFMEAYVAAAAPRATAAECRLHLEPSASNHRFFSDPALLRRVLDCLLANAIEASGPGEEVSLGISADASDLLLWIRNAAVMPPEVCLQIFNRSFTRKDRGRGLGTYMAKLFTEQYLLGKLRFTSTAATGTTFTIALPPNPLSLPMSAIDTPPGLA